MKNAIEIFVYMVYNITNDKEEILMGGIVKEPKKKYKMGLGKKIVAALCAVLIVVGVGLGVYFGLANKDNNNIIDQPGIEQPENPENPGGDIEQPEDPENPGGDIEDPKDPFVLDTLDELMAYRQGTLYNTLNENFMDGILYRCTLSHDYTYQDATNIEWTILESSQTDISKVQVRFNITTGNTYRYYVGEATFKEPISVQDFANANITQSMVDQATYKYTYTGSALADQLENYKPLAEAIVTKLGGTVGADDQLLLTMNNPTTEPEYSWARIINVKQTTETGVNEYSLVVKAESASDEDGIKKLIENIESGKCKNGTVEKNVIELAPAFDENSVDKQTPEFEETAKTASRVSIGRMTNEKGDVYDLYLDL